MSDPGLEPPLTIPTPPDMHYEEAALNPDVVVSSTRLFDVEGHDIYADGENEFVILPADEEARAGSRKNLEISFGKNEQNQNLHYIVGDVSEQ
jgi:hypothetical protein